MIERQIIIGLIVSTEYLIQIRHIWNIKFLESSMAKRIAAWCWEYFDQYGEAPNQQIEAIYFDKLKNGLDEEIAEEIEEEILPNLSNEYKNEKFNLQYLLDKTEAYFSKRNLHLFSIGIQAKLLGKDIHAAEEYASSYAPLKSGEVDDIDLSNEVTLEKLDRAFSNVSRPVLKYPGPFGDFWNHQLVRDNFIAFLAPEKRGKTFMLMDMAMRGAKQGAKVAFFQAGDMTEDQQLIRISIYLATKSTKEKYLGIQYQPVRDCIKNQLDTCDKKERECDFGIFEGRSEKTLKQEITQEELIEAYKENKKYRPCHNCKQFWHNKWGVPFVKKINLGNDPLEVKEAKEYFTNFFIRYKRNFKLSTHPNGTLTINKIKSILNTWERFDGFVPDIILVDYADLLVTPKFTDTRTMQNEIWKGLRGLNQEKHCLMVTATQADAMSYEQDTLRLKNFSEDKRKYAHVSAMYGMNQDPKSREKKIGLLRFNELVVREDDFLSTNQVTVLQNLKRGRPFLGSYF